MDKEALIREALKAQGYSYSPYSGFCVGAALLDGNGIIYTGCNIENAAYSPSNCAERTAFFKAISSGSREFVAIAIVGKYKQEQEGNLCFPCGVCLQVMMEFCDPKKFLVMVASNLEHYEEFFLYELYPNGFNKNNLGIFSN